MNGFHPGNKYKEEESLLSSSFLIGSTVCGTEQFHAFMLVKKVIVIRKICSASSNCTENHMFSVVKDIIELKDITDL
jgi:hypothetical protein